MTDCRCRIPGRSDATNHNLLHRVSMIPKLITMAGRWLRVLLAGVIFLSLQALGNPGVASPFAPKQRMSCCQDTAPTQTDGCAGKHHPVPSPTVPCCPGCTMVLTPFFAPTYPPAFSPDAGETCSLASLIRVARSERPPVPPPRTSAA